MNVAEFESWLNAVQNVRGDYRQEEARAVLVKQFSESAQREAGLWSDYLAMERIFTERVKTLEDENGRLLLASRYNSDVADQALAAMNDANAEAKSLEDALRFIRDFPSATGDIYKATEVYKAAMQALAAKGKS